MPGSARDVKLLGDLAYVADWDFGLRVIDVSHPAFPRERGAIKTWNARDVEVVGNLAYLADGDTGGRRVVFALGKHGDVIPELDPQRFHIRVGGLTVAEAVEVEARRESFGPRPNGPDCGRCR